MRLARLAPTPESALPLALLRIAVALIALVATESAIAGSVVTRSPALWTVPEGLRALVALAPPSPRTVGIAVTTLRASAALAAMGLFSRASCAVLAASMFYVFGVAQLAGTVMHDMHLIWFAAACALAPSGDALSLDAWARRRSLLGGPARPESAVTLAVAACRAWLALVYFFPGAHKLASGGVAWVASENLRNQMHFKWFEMGGITPWPRVDLVPGLLHVAAAGVIAFELSMPALVASRRARPVALCFALLFHAAAGHFLRVPFPALAACLVVLLPAEPLRAWLAARLPARATGADGPETPRDARKPHALLAVAAAFTAAIVVQGVRGQTEAFPFACYPTFESLAPDVIVDLAVDVDAPSAAPATFRMRRPRSQDEWGFVWRVAGLYGDPIDPARLRAFERLVVPRELPRARVRWVRESYAVRPDAYGAGPVGREVIFEERR